MFADAETVPPDLIQRALRAILGNPTAAVTHVQVEPMTEGYGGHRLWRARVAWDAPEPGEAKCAATWVVKHWRPGGQGEHLLGIRRPLEALAWLQGLLQPGLLPDGVVVPILWTEVDAGETAAWVVMEDVADALDRFSRARPLPAAEAVARAKVVLDGLARLHAHYERPQGQAAIGRCRWLVPFERFLWCDAASYAAALGRPVPRGVPPGPPPAEERRADLEAFMGLFTADDRRRVATLLCDRAPLVAALRGASRTLLHGDADTRNCGLRGVDGDLVSGEARALVLIDWEWVGYGPAAWDVAVLWRAFIGVCDRTQGLPQAVFTEELAEHYFECYRAVGGRLAVRDDWLATFRVASLATSLTQAVFVGSLLRRGGSATLPARRWESLLPAVHSLLAG